jgi:hypothetical protein
MISEHSPDIDFEISLPHLDSPDQYPTLIALTRNDAAKQLVAIYIEMRCLG